MGFLAGCRASKESKTRSERTDRSEIGVELRKADCLWSSIAERLNFKIEFYPLEYGPGKPATDSTCPTAPISTMPAASSRTTIPTRFVGSGGMGAVKSIEFSAEHATESGNATQVDSTYNSKTDTTETRQEEKASEARHDNGTVIGVAIVAAVAALVYFLLKQFLKK